MLGGYSSSSNTGLQSTIGLGNSPDTAIGGGSSNSGIIGGGIAGGMQNAQSIANQSGNDSTIQSNPDYAITQFYNSMFGPLNMDDPQIQSLLQGAQSSVMAGANARGIQGPMAINAGQNASIGQAMNMQMQNYGQGLNALGTLGQNQLGYGSMGVNAQLGYGNLGLSQVGNTIQQQGQDYNMNSNDTWGPAQMVAGAGGKIIAAAATV